MKVTTNSGEVMSKIISMKDMVSDVLYKVVTGSQTGCIVCKFHYDAVTNLTKSHDGNSWSVIGNNNIKVIPLEKGESITLTQE